jgi:sec-independent protein translocase protein TatA
MPKYKIHGRNQNMGFDDPVVIILILAVAVFLFGAGRIPQFARSLGQARREFDKAVKGNFDDPQSAKVEVAVPTTQVASPDPLIEAAKREGIDTNGKTKQEVASALSWKLNNRPE